MNSSKDYAYADIEEASNYSQLLRGWASYIEQAMKSGQEINREEIAEIANSMKLLSTFLLIKAQKKDRNPFEVEKYLSPEDIFKYNEMFDKEEDWSTHVNPDAQEAQDTQIDIEFHEGTDEELDAMLEDDWTNDNTDSNAKSR